jgi:hypothetical protein
VLVLSLALVAGCAQPSADAHGATPAHPTGTDLPAADAAAPPGASAATARPNKGRCGGRIEDAYLRIIDAPDPATVARAYQLRFQDGRVEVQFGLLGQDLAGIEAAVTRRYDLREARRATKVMLALAPVQSLCDLAQAPQVRGLSTPSRPKVGP